MTTEEKGGGGWAGGGVWGDGRRRKEKGKLLSKETRWALEKVNEFLPPLRRSLSLLSLPLSSCLVLQPIFRKPSTSLCRARSLSPRPSRFSTFPILFSDPLDVASSKVASSDVATSTSSFSQKPLHPAPACQLRSLAVQPVPRQVLVAEDHLLAEPYGHLGHRLQGHAVQVGPVGGPQVRDRDGRRPDG